jgi:tail protein
MAVLSDDFSWVLSATGVVLNPTNPTPPFIDITEVTGYDSAELRTTERDHEGVDGGFLDALFEKMRTVTLEGQLIVNDYSTVESYLDTLKSNWGPVATPIPLYHKLPGVAERVLFVKPLGVKYNINQLRRTGATDVQLMAQAEDPRIYSSDAFTFPINQGIAATTGIGFDLGFNMDFGTVVAPTSTNAGNPGNRSTPWIINIPGPVTTPRIYNDTTGDVLEFQITLGATDYLTIDSYYRTVKLNGTASRRSSLTNPNWFFLQPGDNFLRYQADTSGNPAATITYRPAWR